MSELPPLGALPLVVRRDELRPIYAEAEGRRAELDSERRRCRDLEAELTRLRRDAARALTALDHGDDRQAVRLIRDVVTNADRRIGAC